MKMSQLHALHIDLPLQKWTEEQPVADKKETVVISSL